MINHELIHKTIIDSGGVIVGGYIRAWVSSGEPTENGWEDIDVYGIVKSKQQKIEEKIQEATGGRGVDFKYTGMVCNFYCNSWIYDGKSIYREKTKYGDLDDLEVLEQTKAKMAVLLSDNAFGMDATLSAILKYMRKYNFTIHNADKSLFDLKKNFNLWTKYLKTKHLKFTFSSEAEKTMVEFSLRNIP